jgi:hypothetical protein
MILNDMPFNTPSEDSITKQLLIQATSSKATF